RRCSFDFSTNVLRRPSAISGVNYCCRALRMHDNAYPWMGCARLIDLSDGKSFVHRAEAVPQNHSSCLELRFSIAAECEVRTPQRHFCLSYAHRLCGVSTQMLVGKEDHALTARECPLEHGPGVRRRAHDAAIS